MGDRVRAIRSDLVTDVERPWVELFPELGVVDVRDLLIDAGVTSYAFAAGLAVWLHDQAERRRHLSAPTVSGYRRVLRDIGPPDRDRLRAIPGYIKEAA